MTKEEIEKQIHDFALRINSMGFLDGYAKGLNDRKKEIEKAKREGYDEGVKHGHEDKTSEMLVDTYTQGLNDAWEAAKKIILGVNHGGLADDEIMTIFDKTYTGVLVENTAAEVVTQIQEYERSTHDNESAGELMDFPDTFDEFVEQYAFKDTNEVYTNGIELIPVFRVRQWMQNRFGMMMDPLKVEEGKSCRKCFWDKYRDAQHPTGNPCDSCVDFSNFSPETAPEEQIKDGCVSCSSKIDDNHFKVSDEVTCGDDVYKGIITKVLHDSSRVSVMFTTGESMIFPMDDVHKTGKSHPELITILSKLRK